jgi:hypothetical protein
MPQQVDPFRVLAIDGGGIRGLYTAQLLHTLAAHFRKKGALDAFHLGTRFNLIGGTSTGGILACGLASGKETSELIRLYERIGPNLFIDPMPDGKLLLVWWALRNLFKPANRAEPLKRALAETFGDATLESVFAKYEVALCLPACHLLNWKPKVFKTPHLPSLTRDGEVTLVDACLATSAAPLFLPVAEVRETGDAAHLGKFVDGGLWANNPAVVALLEAIDICTHKGGERFARPIQILSVGTSGGTSGDDPRDGVNRGLLQWKFGGEAANMSISVQGFGWDFIAKKLMTQFGRLGIQIEYARIENPPVTEAQARQLKLDLATPSALTLMKQLGEQQAQSVLSECANQTPLGNLVTSLFQ